MPATARLDPRPVRRVILVRPRFIGDVCLTLPALDAVRAACPEARVGYVVEQESAPLLEGDPRVDELFVVKRSPGALSTAKLVSSLRKFGPEVAFDFFCNPRTALWCRLSGARVRVGYPYKGWRSSLYTHHARPRTLSAIGFHLASLETIGWPAPMGVPKLVISDAARAEAREGLREIGVPDDALLLGMHPGARWPTRRWGTDEFVQLGRMFFDESRTGLVIVTGGPAERALVEGVVRALGARARSAVAWPLARFVALQSLCGAFVCGDTGPMHTAVAAGTRTLGLLSRNRPAMFFPYPESAGHRAYSAHAECSPCHRDRCPDLRCLKRLTSDGAWRLLKPMLGLPRSPSLELVGDRP